MGRRKKKKADQEVELNMAAMLDMAFQLLTFFILTFRPAPVEGQITLKLPPPQAIKNISDKPAGETPSNELPPGVETLVISAFAEPNGRIAQLAIGDKPVGGLIGLANELKSVFSDPANPFEQVIVQVSDKLRYDELMRVIEVCAKQKHADGKPLTKLSFVEAPSGGGDAGK